MTLFNELYYLVAGGTVWTGQLLAAIAFLVKQAI